MQRRNQIDGQNKRNVTVKVERHWPSQSVTTVDVWIVIGQVLNDSDLVNRDAGVGDIGGFAIDAQKVDSPEASTANCRVHVRFQLTNHSRIESEEESGANVVPAMCALETCGIAVRRLR